MSQLLIPDVDPVMLTQLQQRASQHGRTLEDEARTILECAAVAQIALGMDRGGCHSPTTCRLGPAV